MYYLESAGACGGVRKEVAIMETVLAVLEVMLRKTEVVVGEGRGSQYIQLPSGGMRRSEGVNTKALTRQMPPSD